jgi:rare lipoprotein A
MLNLALTRPGRASAVAALAIAAAFLAACAAPQAKSMVNKNKRSKEYFAESEYGVKASPRVTAKLANLQRGGGRDQVGRPYKVRGKMYYPKEDKNYKKVGAASWYGDAFHGRLTANGEIYDMRSTCRNAPPKCSTTPITAPRRCRWNMSAARRCTAATSSS